VVFIHDLSIRQWEIYASPGVHTRRPALSWQGLQSLLCRTSEDFRHFTGPSCFSRAWRPSGISWYTCLACGILRSPRKLHISQYTPCIYHLRYCSTNARRRWKAGRERDRFQRHYGELKPAPWLLDSSPDPLGYIQHIIIDEVFTRTTIY
jgi:hypothetical protein